MALKRGLNITDMNRCKQYVTDGHTAEEISAFLLVELSVVSKFVEHYKKGNAAKKRPVDLKTEKDVENQKSPAKAEGEETEKPVKTSSRKRS